MIPLTLIVFMAMVFAYWLFQSLTKSGRTGFKSYTLLLAFFSILIIIIAATHIKTTKIENQHIISLDKNGDEQ